MHGSNSIAAYNNPQKADSYHRNKGFDPPRKGRMAQVVTRTLLDLTRPGSDLLELGAGSGDLTSSMLRAAHFGRVLATDGAAAMQAIAERELGHLSGLEFALLDFTEPGWGRAYPEGFDAVCSSMALHHAENKTAVFAEVHTALKPGGWLVFSDTSAGCRTTGRG